MVIDAKNADALTYSSNMLYDYTVVSTKIFEYTSIQFKIWDQFSAFRNDIQNILVFQVSVYDPRFSLPAR
jgi:hypothetical protein